MPTDDPGPVPTGAYGGWPGIDEKSGQVYMDREKLKKLAVRLEHHLEDLLSAHQKLEPAPPAAYGKWDAAQAFYPSVQEGHRTLADQHGRFLHALMDMIKKLHRTAQASEDTEAELERRIASVDRRMHGLKGS
jgi:hypothetical protein